jgi:hypothetical protein
MFLKWTYSFSLNADRAPQLKASVMWLRGSYRRPVDSVMKYSRNRRAFLALLLLVFFCSLRSAAGGAHLRKVKLTDHDRAAIIGSVARNIFKPGSTYQGQYFIIAPGIQPEWIPNIPGYQLSLVTRKQADSSNPLLCYIVRLQPLKTSVRVTVHLYTAESGTTPEVMLYYSYRRVGLKWRGRYLGGGGS